jgi:hypothetical protein
VTEPTIFNPSAIMVPLRLNILPSNANKPHGKDNRGAAAPVPHPARFVAKVTVGAASPVGVLQLSLAAAGVSTLEEGC